MNYESRIMVFRHTPQRMLVLRTVKASRQFQTAVDVFRAVKQQFPRIGFATVYRNLNLLRNRGEIFGFKDKDGVRRFAGFVFHSATFTCERCGRAAPVNLKRFDEQVQAALPRRTVYFSRLEVRGLCPEHGRLATK
ncbi:MAG: transcriptional repressor [Candidatus Kerfeldbacteria bacterium]|nr:transcriptional repressor [Candidatus Kerfeldbacteria bacterium]